MKCPDSDPTSVAIAHQPIQINRFIYGWIVACAAFLLFSCSNHAELEGAAPEVAFKTLTGERIELQHVAKPLLVSFWSTSCGICLEEMPELARLYEDLAPRGFELIAVAMPYDKPSAVVELVADRQYPFPVAIDIDGKVADAFAPVKGTPTHFLVDANAQFVDRYVGAVNIKALRSQLDSMLDGG